MQPVPHARYVGVRRRREPSRRKKLEGFVSCSRDLATSHFLRTCVGRNAILLRISVDPSRQLAHHELAGKEFGITPEVCRRSPVHKHSTPLTGSDTRVFGFSKNQLTKVSAADQIVGITAPSVLEGPSP